jgi:hypothetical protein
MRPDLVVVGSVVLQNATQLRFVEFVRSTRRFLLFAQLEDERAAAAVALVAG